MPVRRLARRAGKWWLSWRYRHFSPDTGTARHVRVAGLTLLLEPTVFNPNLHFSSGFLAEYLRQEDVVAKAGRVLDIGTGSGLLAISAALAGARQVTAVDLNPAAVLAARMNVSLYALAGKVRVVHGDLFEPVAGERFDLVVCNPPYLRGEPSSPGTLAYMAGEDFRWLRRFSQAAADYLTPGGRCLLVLADSTDLRSIWKIFKDDGWSVRRLAARDVLVERLYIVALQRPR
ncbi:MAG: methyltransferase [Chloroflexota bacterium]|nr:methyltransferase [Chloroflexota bacterium]